jgi:hypothetical protein
VRNISTIEDFQKHIYFSLFLDRPGRHKFVESNPFMQISPHSSGLFRRSIFMSGSMAAPANRMDDKDPAVVGMAFADYLGCSTQEADQLQEGILSQLQSKRFAGQNAFSDCAFKGFSVSAPSRSAAPPTFLTTGPCLARTRGCRWWTPHTLWNPLCQGNRWNWFRRDSSIRCQ